MSLVLEKNTYPNALQRGCLEKTSTSGFVYLTEEVNCGSGDADSTPDVGL
jgi:hypothetical protein